MHGADAVFKIYQEHCTMCTAHVIFTVCRKEFQFRAFFFWPVLFCTQSGVSASSSVPNDLVQVHQEHLVQVHQEHLVQVHGHSRRGRGWVAVKLQPGEDERSTACLAGALNKASFVPRTMCNSSEYGSCALVQCSVCTLAILSQIKSFQGQLNWH